MKKKIKWKRKGWKNPIYFPYKECGLRLKDVKKMLSDISKANENFISSTL